MDKIKKVLAGKKTYLTAMIGLLSAALAWATGEASLTEAGVMAWGALSAIFIRSGVTSEVKKLAAEPKDAAYANPAKGMEAGQLGQ